MLWTPKHLLRRLLKGSKHLPTCLRIHFNSYEGLELVVGCFVIFLMEPEGVYNKYEDYTSVPTIWVVEGFFHQPLHSMVNFVVGWVGSVSFFIWTYVGPWELVGFRSRLAEPEKGSPREPCIEHSLVTPIFLPKLRRLGDLPGGGFKYVFFFSPLPGERFPIWLIFFKGVGSTTN